LEAFFSIALALVADGENNISTIYSNLTAIKEFASRQNHSIETLLKTHKFKDLEKELKEAAGPDGSQTSAEVNIEMVKKFVDNTNWKDNWDDLVACTVVTTAHATLGRIPELLHAKHHEPLMPSRVIMVGGRPQIKLVRAKTRPNEQQVLRPFDRLYPGRYKASGFLIQMLDSNIRPEKAKDHFFQLADGSRATASWLFKRFTEVTQFNPQVGEGKLGPSSFRAGGATYFANKGVSTDTIQILGRWDSDAFRCYLRLKPHLVTDH
jgi:hypothetical protein